MRRSPTLMIAWLGLLFPWVAVAGITIAIGVATAAHTVGGDLRELRAAVGATAVAGIVIVAALTRRRLARH